MPEPPAAFRRRDLARAAGFALAATAAGCAGVGPQRLDMDQMGYASALGDGLKRQMLLNMVRLRYADVPAFVTASQLISGYTLQGTAQLGLNTYPTASPSNYATAGGAVQYTTRPTFTFTPVTGDRFALSYLRPLAPAELLSLAQSGAPIDLLFRVGVHAVNGAPNETTSGHGTREPASEGFRGTVRALGDVQAAGGLGLRFDRRPAPAAGAPAVSRVHLVLDGHDRRALDAAREARRVLGLAPGAREAEVVYGHTPKRRGQVAVLTRSVLHILHELGAGIDVPEADVRGGETLASRAAGAGAPPPALAGREALIVVRQGRSAPPDAYAAVPYRDRWFWIEAGDYRSKIAFTFAYILQTLAESSHTQATPVVTIPTQ